MTTYLALLQLKEEMLEAMEYEKEIIESSKEIIKQLRREGAPQENIWVEQDIIRESRIVISVLKHFSKKIDEILKDI